MTRTILLLALVLGLGACSSNTPIGNNPGGYHTTDQKGNQ